MVNHNQVFYLFVFALYLFSFNIKENKPTEGIRIGNELPVQFFKSDNVPEIEKQLESRLVFLEFWDSRDVQVRFDAPAKFTLYNRYKSLPFINGHGFTILSINYDKSDAVFRRLVGKEAMLWPYHTHISPNALTLFFDKYADGDSCNNVLLDGVGRVLAVDLTVDELKSELDKFAL